LPDEGYRYQDTVYSDEWLRAQGLAHAGAAEPYEVVAPAEPGGSWTWLNWGRRSLADAS
jgi:cysteine synthase A